MNYFRRGRHHRNRFSITVAVAELQARARDAQSRRLWTIGDVEELREGIWKRPVAV